MEKYEYTPTEAKWINKIPSHWECKKIGNLFTQRNEKVSDKVYKPLSVSKNGVVPQLESAVKTDAGDNRKLVLKGDFVINSRSDRKGSCGVSPLDGSVSLINIVLKPRRSWNEKYVHYLMRCHLFSEEYYRNGRGIVADLWTTRYSEMKSILLPVPPRKEQDQIVRYLDWQTSKINQLIDAKKKQIQVLREHALSGCNELLTRGINSNVTFQPTGSNWMGEIPAHWKISKIAKHFTIKKRIAGKEGYDVLSITQQGLKVKDISTNEGQMAANYSGYQFVYPGDFAMNHMDLLTGYIDISKYFGVTSPDYRVFVLDDTENCYPEYYLQLFQLCYKRKIFYGYGRGAANQGRWRMPAVNFRNFEIPLPPYEEQKIISAKIQEINARIESACSKLESEISTLSEMKTRLVSDVVTGQIDVRNIDVPAFESVEEMVDDADIAEDVNVEEEE